MSKQEGKIPASDSVLFILVCFSVGVLIRLGLKWTRIPYTAMLLLVGLAIGFLQLAHPATEAFTNTLKLWLAMEPHLLLLIFLPIIGFSAAIAQEPHMLRKSWGQIMLLAWPGVVVQFLLIALCAKYFFPYSWSWPEAFLFGAMMSATDPVAVVAVLQEVGASQKLACVIDGESLMNDGSALVIFLVLQKIVEGQAVTVGGAIAQFCLLAVVGMLMGIACGLLTAWLLDNIFRDPTLTTIITLLSAYSSYYVADRLVGASGLLAVVMNGFTMSISGGRDLTLRVEDAMHAFWGVLEWGANTILFVWMGIVLAIVLPPSHEETAITSLRVHLVPSDFGYMVVLFLWLQVARAVLLLLCWIPFRYTGYPMTWRTALVFLWGGLRGAVGMVMALFVFLDEEIHNSRFRSYCIFYMGTMAFFTVLLNGGSVKWLLKTLGFMSYTPEQLATLQHVVQDMDGMREQRLNELRPDDVLGEPEPDVVKVWTSLPTTEMLSQAAANTVRPPLNPHSPAVQAAAAAGLDPQLLYDYRCRILHMVKAHYAEAYGHHLLSTQQVRTLQGAADKALDDAGEGLRDWSRLQPAATLRGLPRLIRAWGLHRLSGTLAQAGVYRQQLSNLTLLVAFIHAHRHAQEVLRDHIQAVADEPVVAALSRTSRADSLASSTMVPLRELLERFSDIDGGKGGRGGAEALFVLQESQSAAAAAQSLAEKVTFSHPSLPAWLRSKQVAASILTEQHSFLQHLADAGLVQARELLLLEELMHERFKLLLQSNTGLTAALSYSRSRPPINLLPLFDSLDDAQAAALMREGSSRVRWASKEPSKHSAGGSSSRCYWKVFYPEQVIATAGGPVHEVVVITKGSVRMRFPPPSTPHGGVKEHTVVASVGDPLGVCELMLGYTRLADLTADSMVQVLMVPTQVFISLVKTVPGIYTRAWQATAAQLAAQHHHILGEHRQLAPLNMFFRRCVVECIEPGQTFEVPRTALLLTGAVRSLLPLPASFSRAVQNPKRTTSAADLLWPSNITNTWDPIADAAAAAAEAAASLTTRASDGCMLVHSGSREIPGSSMGHRHQSAPDGLHLDGLQEAAGQLGQASSEQQQQQQQQPGVAHSAASAADGGAVWRGASGSSASSAAGGRQKADARAVSEPGGVAAGGDGGGSGDALKLVAPAELPPGEFKGLVEAMVLQVPRGATLPASLETITYQAQVLGKGSIQPELLGRQGSGSTSPDVGPSSKALSSRSWSPNLRSPLKDALQRLSRISRIAQQDKASTSTGSDRGGGSELASQGSDVLPKMQFLQRALKSMQSNPAERYQGSTPVARGAADPQARGGAAGGDRTALHTVIEVAAPVSGVDASAAAAAGGARAAELSAAAARQLQRQQPSRGTTPSPAARPTGAQPEQQQQRPRSLDRPPSFELRATEVVLGSAQLRRRMLAGDGDGAGGSPRGAAAGGGGDGGVGVGAAAASPSGLAEASGYSEGFVSRPARPLIGSGAGQLSSSFKRRSANLS